eukprot:scaffold396_cov252-Pinguiococcus_pyrenoidosus.AAC.6
MHPQCTVLHRASLAHLLHHSRFVGLRRVRLAIVDELGQFWSDETEGETRDLGAARDFARHPGAPTHAQALIRLDLCVDFRGHLEKNFGGRLRLYGGISVAKAPRVLFECGSKQNNLDQNPPSFCLLSAWDSAPLRTESSTVAVSELY